MTAAWMSDSELVQRADDYSRQRAWWRNRAAQCGVSVDSLDPERAARERRRCLSHARKYEARILDLAIAAEQRCRLFANRRHA